MRAGNLSGSLVTSELLERKQLGDVLIYFRIVVLSRISLEVSVVGESFPDQCTRPLAKIYFGEMAGEGFSPFPPSFAFLASCSALSPPRRLEGALFTSSFSPGGTTFTVIRHVFLAL